MLNKLGNKSKMKNDSLKIHKNEDGSFSMEWDKNDPSYQFLNNLTQEQIQSIILNDMNSR